MKLKLNVTKMGTGTPFPPRYMLIFSIALIAFFSVALPASAASAYFIGQKLPHNYLTIDNRQYFALDDIQGQLGLSVVSQRHDLLIGGAARGSLSVDTRFHIAKIGDQQIDFETRMRQDHGLWYVPDRFLELALGVRAKPKPNSQDFVLYPEVVAITPTPSAIVTISSLAPDFTTFELDNPPRRIVDIRGEFLQGPNLNIPGAMLGTVGIAALRVSQFTVEPPTVRVVVEWSGDRPPTHTLFPDHRALAVLVGADASDSIPINCINLLASGSGPDTGPQLVPSPVVPPQPPVAPAPTPEPAPPTAPPPPIPHVDPAAFKGMENYSLDRLGWSIDSKADGKDSLTTLKTPPFSTLNEFTLAGGGGMRLVLDIQGTYIPGDERHVDGQGDIARIRIHQFQPQTTRIVFDLKHVVGYDIQKDPAAGLISVKLLTGDLSGRTIVIDPGHGGEDPGAVAKGVEEKHLNMQMSMVLKNLLEQHGARVILTRTSDCYLSLADRVNMANNCRADLFICVHNNATDDPTTMQGSMILYNDPRYLPLYRLAHRGIAARTGVPGIGPITDTRGLYVLRHCTMPVLLVEGAFLTNTIDFARLTDASGAYGRNIMQGVADGVLAYYEGRDLPPVNHPDPAHDNSAIFDLGGGPLVPASGTPGDTSGSAWDTSNGQSADESTPAPAPSESVSSSPEPPAASSSNKSSDSSSSSDRNNEYHRRRGRGAYRYHH